MTTTQTVEEINSLASDNATLRERVEALEAELRVAQSPTYRAVPELQNALAERDRLKLWLDTVLKHLEEVDDWTLGTDAVEERDRIRAALAAEHQGGSADE